MHCACAYAHADQGIYFPQMYDCKHVWLIILTLEANCSFFFSLTPACKGVN